MKAQMKVRLLAYTPAPEKTVASAAKLCYSSATIDGLREKISDESAAGFLQMLNEIGHQSPIEHASFTFGIEGVSRALLAQITRHRIASYSVQSQRYVREGDFDYVLPPEIEADGEAAQLFEQAMKSDQEYYDRLTEILSKKHYEEMLREGMQEADAKKAALKKAIEDARFVLPNACDTKMIVTMNARSLSNFFAHRCCNRAQWEIRELAFLMLQLVREVAPNLFAKAGPPCFAGVCPEGKMSCGKMKEMREKYAFKVK